MPVITLTTDFGLSDPYVGIMKGVILGICPGARLVDLTHSIPPQELAPAVLTLRASIPFFPKGTIHLAVVDPGVGTSRRGIAAEFDGGILVGPDNGIIPAALGGKQITRAVSLEADACRLHPVSETFHGRDIFAPAAAHLARGAGLETLGPMVEDPVTIDIPQPLVVENEDSSIEVSGQILYADHFGNLITNIPRELIESADEKRAVRVTIGETTIAKISRTYSDGVTDQPVALFGSHGHLEIACNQGSAQEKLGAQKGDVVRVELTNREL